MLNSSICRVIKPLKNIRSISRSVILRETKPASGSPARDDILVQRMVPTEFDKKVLVWTKKYPNIEAIPPRVTIEAIQNAHSRMRIRMCNYMMIMTLLGCAYVIISGKIRVQNELKTVEVEQDDLRRQIIQEYRTSLSKESAK